MRGLLRKILKFRYFGSNYRWDGMGWMGWTGYQKCLLIFINLRYIENHSHIKIFIYISRYILTSCLHKYLVGFECSEIRIHPLLCFFFTKSVLKFHRYLRGHNDKNCQFSGGTVHRKGLIIFIILR